jgi:hypothetical protein
MPAPSSPDGSGNPDAPELMPIIRPSEVPTAPVASPSDVPTAPVTANPGDEPTEPVTPSVSPTSPPDPAPADPPQVVPPPASPPAPEKWAGRVVVPGATAPGQKKAAAPTEPTQHMARLESAPTVLAPRAPGLRAPAGYRPPRQRGRRRGRRALIALFALVLLIAVPVTSAYVAYKLTAGENPFEWPPTVDYDKIFDR